MDGLIHADGWMGGWVGGWMDHADGWVDRQIDRQIDWIYHKRPIMMAKIGLHTTMSLKGRVSVNDLNVDLDIPMSIAFHGIKYLVYPKCVHDDPLRFIPTVPRPWLMLGTRCVLLFNVMFSELIEEGKNELNHGSCEPFATTSA